MVEIRAVKTLGISLMLVLLSGSLVSPIAILSAFATIQTVPLHPTALNATAISGSQIFLMWTVPVNATQDGVSGYKIEMRSSCSGSFNFLVNTTTTNFLNTGLTNGTCYQFRVFAINSVGISSTSNNATATTLSVPSAPTNLVAKAVSSSQIKLGWSAPSNNGGTPITGYKIEKKNGCAGSFIILAHTVNSSTLYSDTGLIANTCYLYRVSAINVIGTSSPSADAIAITNSSLTHVPSAPTGLHVTTVSNTTLKLTWHSPSSSGDSPITGYLIQRNGTTIVINTFTNQTNFTDTNLLPNHKETYRTASWNSVGLGAFSNSASGITINSTSVSPPGTPGNLTGTGTLPSNLGQLISDFVHNRNALLKQERAAILNAIHECHAEIKNASHDDKKQIHDECKAKIKELREKYKESRKQLQEEFKQLREQSKLQIEDEKIKLENATHAASDLGKEIKQSEKENEQSVGSIANHESVIKHFDNTTNNLAKEIKHVNKDLKKNKGKSEGNKKRNHNQED